MIRHIFGCQADFGQRIAMMLGVICSLVVITKVQCGIISEMYEKVPSQNYSILSASCEIHSPPHFPVHATTCGHMCITVDCFVFSQNATNCAVCHYMETSNANVPSWQSFKTVYKKRKFISFTVLIA